MLLCHAVLLWIGNVTAGRVEALRLPLVLSNMTVSSTLCVRRVAARVTGPLTSDVRGAPLSYLALGCYSLLLSE